MITFTNGRKIEYFVASGALAFDGKGWPWEWPLIWSGLIQTKLFGVVLKSLTLQPRKGNLRWWKPWECVRPISGRGAVNKVGLTNPGFDWWMKVIAPKLDFGHENIIVSLFGSREEIVQMATQLEYLRLTAIEINVSCPNTGHSMDATWYVIETVKWLFETTTHPIIVKISCNQDYLAITRRLKGYVEAVSVNSVPWEIAFPEKRSPLHVLERRVGGGGGGVSGVPAQSHNWKVVEEIARLDIVPVIAPSIMEFGDLDFVRAMGAKAVSFGTIHLPTKGKPWTLFTNPIKPTQIVLKDMASVKNTPQEVWTD